MPAFTSTQCWTPSRAPFSASSATREAVKSCTSAGGWTSVLCVSQHHTTQHLDLAAVAALAPHNTTQHNKTPTSRRHGPFCNSAPTDPTVLSRRPTIVKVAPDQHFPVRRSRCSYLRHVSAPDWLLVSPSLTRARTLQTRRCAWFVWFCSPTRSPARTAPPTSGGGWMVWHWTSWLTATDFPLQTGEDRTQHLYLGAVCESSVEMLTLSNKL